ncbi:MAG: DUF2505 domain-containing protein [Solirubrobacterales bacterium]
MPSVVSLNFSIPASPSVLMGLMQDRDFIVDRLTVLAASTAEVREHGFQGETLVTTVYSTVPRTKLPKAVRGFVRGEPGFSRTERWSPAADGYDCLMEVDLSGTPSDITGQMQLRPDEAGSSLSLDCDIKIPLPMFGAQVEATLVREITDIAHAETQFLCERVGGATS